jgi:hypothetical protein
MYGGYKFIEFMIIFIYYGAVTPVTETDTARVAAYV